MVLRAKYNWPEFDMYTTKYLTVAIKVLISGFYTLLSKKDQLDI